MNVVEKLKGQPVVFRMANYIALETEILAVLEVSGMILDDFLSDEEAHRLLGETMVAFEAKAAEVLK